MRAILAKRTDAPPADTAEIRALAERAGHEVVGERTQVRAADPAYDLGPGAVADVADLADERDASVVVVDGELTPTQAVELRSEMPPGVDVKDRRRLVLDVFRAGAGTKEARLQVRLAELEYELPRVRAAIRRDEATEIAAHDEEGKPIEDRKRQIDGIRRTLAEIDRTTAARRHERRREAGFDLVALAGYTNAGKTTLLRQLADDLSLATGGHGDLAETAAVDDRLFETLGTTTRRATIEGRNVLLTDTVGFVRDLPHELVAAFRSTLEAVYRADVVLLVVDASDPPDEVRGKVTTVQAELANGRDGATPGTILPVLNKVDRLDPGDLGPRRDAVAAVGDPVAVSATAGTNLDLLGRRVRASLPEECAALSLPNCGEAMRFVSWAYDNTAVEDVTYDGEEVVVTFAARPEVVERARARAGEIR